MLKVSLQITCAFLLMSIAQAEMQSAHHTLTIGTLSVASSHISSQNYDIEFSLGQPSIINSSDISFSDSYDLYAGFWNAIPTPCSGDSESDKDVDGMDLFYFINHFSQNDRLVIFSSEFGRNNCR
jgi:hypothetical protein